MLSKIEETQQNAESNVAPSPPNHAMSEPTSFSDENKKRQASDAI